jgi:hypothetical protein
MDAIRIPCSWLIALLVCCSVVFGLTERPEPARPPAATLGLSPFGSPAVLSYSGDTTWIQVHTDSTYCPGDPSEGHGGEISGGPGPMETWCFEGGPGDTCGTNPPWDVQCFSHMDVRAQPSRTGINFWHVDTYRADQRAYCGDYCLWCGSDSLWTDGNPVECNTWAKGKKPGYGNQWNCIAELSLLDTFDVAEGCTLYFDPRYDTECAYDYFYVDFWNGTEWKTLAAFNSTSNTGGGTCGPGGLTTPDYFGNSDTGQPNSADWQERFDPDLPAFYRVLTPDTLLVTSGPKFRWRFTSDGAWSDADGRGDTDGAAFVDNVWIWGDGERYEEDFEGGVFDTSLWSLPDPAGIIDAWHISHDPDRPYEGGDGGDRITCRLDSSYIYRGRPEQGFPSAAPWRNQWSYRLMSPAIPMQTAGCIFQYDLFPCALDYTCDYTNVVVRYHSPAYGCWCPWVDVYSYYIPGGCFFWELDSNADVSSRVPSTADSVQFGWELWDTSRPGDFCEGKHKWTDLQVDNVSVGFYDRHATWFSARGIDLFQDTFYDNLCAYNSLFEAYDPDTVERYSGPPYDDVTLQKDEQLYVDVVDEDGLAGVELCGSIDNGATWVAVAMSLDPPAHWGEHYGTLCPTDFGLDTWETGTEVWYYVKATDSLANVAYWPTEADPADPDHTGQAGDYFTFSILPMFPETYTGPKVLLVDGYGRRNYDYAECVGTVDRMRPLEDIYEATLIDAGYCYDVYDISGAGSNVHIHPIWLSDYDCVVWFTGPYYSNYLFDMEAQEAIRDYLGAGGKVVLLGDRIAYSMAIVGEDSLDGEFLGGIMGCDYIHEMEGAFDRPYLYAVGVDSVQVFGTPVELDLDTLLIYRECPYLKDMSYVSVNDPAPTGYTAQRLMYLTEASVGEADEVIYTEYLGVGQCAYVDFDLCASANHKRGYCSGATPGNAPDFAAGHYEGRVDLMRVILEDIFGLPSNGGGGPAHVEPPLKQFRWALAQNAPNPCVTGTAISYQTARRVRVALRMYDALGRRVRTLVDGAEEPGEHTAYWDGCNERGERVTSGVYFYKMEAGDFAATRKMLVLR